MRILWISHVLPYPPKGGVMQRSWNLIKKVAKQNEIFLIAFNQKAWLRTKQEIEAARKKFEKMCKKVEVLDLPSDSSTLSWYKLVLGSFFSPNSYTVNWTMSTEMQRKVTEYLIKEDIDLIHCDTIGLAEYIKEGNKTPKVLNHHSIESAMMFRRARRETNLLKKLYFYFEAKKLQNYEKQNCPKFDMNIVVSELDKNLLLNITPELAIEVIPNGVDTEYFRPLNETISKHNLIFAGRMNQYAAAGAIVFFIRKIYHLLRTEVPDLTLTIAGRNPTRKLQRLAKGDPKIVITGFVDDIRPYISRAEVYVCPIQNGGGTRIKVLDAMAMGKPIVSTSIGCEGIDVMPEKNILVADNPRAFVVQIIRLFDNPTLRVRLEREARKLVEEQYSWEIIGRKLNQLYRSML